VLTPIWQSKAETRIRGRVERVLFRDGQRLVRNLDQIARPLTIWLAAVENWQSRFLRYAQMTIGDPILATSMNGLMK
jgi:hypothetical protein